MYSVTSTLGEYPLIDPYEKVKLKKIGANKQADSTYISYVNSVTRFGKILPTSLWQNINGLFLIWQNDYPILATSLHY